MAVFVSRAAAGFLSTLSLRRATQKPRAQKLSRQFLSTLSLRRATRNFNKSRDVNINFYPRSPCGERQVVRCALIITLKFLSTLSLRRATSSFLLSQIAISISIHALLAESDLTRQGERCTSSIFLSTLSLRRATITIITTCTVSKFLSTLSLRRATQLSIK